MCTASKNTTALRYQQKRRANIAKIKADQAARQAQINIIGGGETEEYRRSIASGAKDVGKTAEDIANAKMSDLFATNKGKGAIDYTNVVNWRKRKQKAADYYKWAGGGEGAP